MILNNTNGRYPQGFQTPGIVRQWQQANGGAINGVRGAGHDTISNAQQFGTWFQDDWRIKPPLTLNLGLRYDVDFNLMDQEKFADQRDADGARERSAIRMAGIRRRRRWTSRRASDSPTTCRATGGA